MKKWFLSVNFEVHVGGLIISWCEWLILSSLSKECAVLENVHTPHRRDRNFLAGGGSLRPKNLKKFIKLHVNWSFQRGGAGVLEKSLPWGRYGYEGHRFLSLGL